MEEKWDLCFYEGNTLTFFPGMNGPEIYRDVDFVRQVIDPNIRTTHVIGLIFRWFEQNGWEKNILGPTEFHFSRRTPK
jgi:hypothetical protein